jgi:PPM family protein phosphatase
MSLTALPDTAIPAFQSWSYRNHDMRGDGVVHECAAGLIGVYSARAPYKVGANAPNEDAAAIFCYPDGTGLLVVADGMGGMPQGAQASGLLIDAIREALNRQGNQRDKGLREHLIDAIDSANLRINALGAGTTVAAIEIGDNAIRTCHVGDSMILVTGNRGRIKLQTVSHSPVGYAVEAGILDEDEAMHHDERNLVSNYVGLPNMRIELGHTLRLAPYDTALLASDGLFDNLYIEEIISRIRSGPLEGAMQHLAAACRARMERPTVGAPSKPDDLTFILYRPHRRRGDRPAP